MSGDQALQTGGLFAFDIETAEAGTQELSWKCYWSGDQMKWELRRIITVAGYTQGQNTYQKLYRHLSENWKSWTTALQQAGLDADTDIGKSKKASRTVGESSSDQEHWISTAGLVWLLVHWAVTRRQVAVRNACFSALVAWLRKSMGASAFAIKGASLPDASDRACCTLDVSDGVCGCVIDWLRERDSIREGHKHSGIILASILVSLQKRIACPSLHRFTARLL
eukprot:6790-Amphidinium_carterae.2